MALRDAGHPATRETPDLPDLSAVSRGLELLASLAGREAFALDRGDLAAAEAIRAAERRLLRDYLTPVVRPFAKQLAVAATGSLSQSLGELLAALVTTNAVPVRRTETDVAVACGGGQE